MKSQSTKKLNFDPRRVIYIFFLAAPRHRDLFCRALPRSVIPIFDDPDFPAARLYSELTLKTRLDIPIFSRGFSSATPGPRSVIPIFYFWHVLSDPLFLLGNGRWTPQSTGYTVSTQITAHNRICHAGPRSEAISQLLISLPGKNLCPLHRTGAGAGAGAGVG